MPQRRLAPRRLRVATRSAAAFATTVRMIERVHRHAANRGANAAPARFASFADNLVLVIDVADLSDGGTAAYIDQSNFTAGHAHLRVRTFFGQQLRCAAGTAHQLSTAPELHLD